VFFAAAVVLTEGDPDEIACRCALEREGLDLDRQSISVVSLGGKDEVETVGHLLMALGIPTFALLDEDPGNADSAATQARAAAAVGADHLLLQRPNLEGVFGLGRKLRRGQAMAWFPAWFAEAGNATPQVYRDLAAGIQAAV
jgi:predicted ATP-dependent endonuclease of OLD family